jgi:hypothetical protein
MAFSRRKLIVGSAAVSVAVAGVAYARQAGEPPTEQWLRDRLWGDNLIAYAVWDGVPRAAVISGKRLAYDEIVPGDWFWPNWPPAPQWQLRGWGYSIAATDEPASIGIGSCPGYRGEACGWPLELYGQVNAPDIVAMEVRFSDGWRRFSVAAPGFAIRLDKNSSWPLAYHWLDAAGRTVWEVDESSPVRPGVREPKPPRRRPRTTPVSGAEDVSS